jgi:hypothetical protein
MGRTVHGPAIHHPRTHMILERPWLKACPSGRDLRQRSGGSSPLIRLNDNPSRRLKLWQICFVLLHPGYALAGPSTDLDARAFGCKGFLASSGWALQGVDDQAVLDLFIRNLTRKELGCAVSRSCSSPRSPGLC